MRAFTTAGKNSFRNHDLPHARLDQVHGQGIRAAREFDLGLVPATRREDDGPKPEHQPAATSGANRGRGGNDTTHQGSPVGKGTRHGALPGSEAWPSSSIRD